MGPYLVKCDSTHTGSLGFEKVLVDTTIEKDARTKMMDVCCQTGGGHGQLKAASRTPLAVRKMTSFCDADSGGSGALSSSGGAIRNTQQRDARARARAVKATTVKYVV